MKRIESVDAFRGLAVVWMVFWQVFDFLARTDIYADAPFFFAQFKLPINGLGAAMFAFICGASIFLSFKRRGRKEFFQHVAKRYGAIILLSLAFTSFVFGFCVFYGWHEALQGIGLAAIFTAAVLMLASSEKIIALIAVVVAAIGIIARQLLPVQVSTATLCPLVSQNPIADFTLNALFRGIFSVSHLLPLMLVGLVVCKLFVDRKKHAQLFLASIALIAVSIVSHFSGFAINYYGISASYLVFAVGVCLFFIALFEYRTWMPLRVFGRVALAAYVAHFVLVYKPLQWLGLENAFGTTESAVMSLAIVAIMLVAGWVFISRTSSSKSA